MKYWTGTMITEEDEWSRYKQALLDMGYTEEEAEITTYRGRKEVQLFDYRVVFNDWTFRKKLRRLLEIL